MDAEIANIFVQTPGERKSGVRWNRVLPGTTPYIESYLSLLFFFQGRRSSDRFVAYRVIDGILTGVIANSMSPLM